MKEPCTVNQVINNPDGTQDIEIVDADGVHATLKGCFLTQDRLDAVDPNKPVEMILSYVGFKPHRNVGAFVNGT
jgi:hypothetical protein